jgi:hypothetical protein
VRFEKPQRNAIYRAIAAGGLEPAECKLEEGSWRPRVIHPPSDSYFQVGRSMSFSEAAFVLPVPAYRIRRAVGGRRPAFRTGRDWAAVIDLVREWAEEVTEPDLWADAQHGRVFPPGDQYEDIRNDPFTPDEQMQVVARLEEVKQYALKYELTDEQAAGIEFTWRWDVDLGGPHGEFLVGHGPSRV